jgi:hypothetical protein
MPNTALALQIRAQAPAIIHWPAAATTEKEAATMALVDTRLHGLLRLFKASITTCQPAWRLHEIKQTWPDAQPHEMASCTNHNRSKRARA